MKEIETIKTSDGCTLTRRILSEDEIYNEKKYNKIVKEAEKEEYQIATWSVEIDGNSYQDDLYNGTYEECCKYLQEKYTRAEAEEQNARLVLIDPEDGCFCLDVINNLDEIYSD